MLVLPAGVGVGVGVGVAGVTGVSVVVTGVGVTGNFFLSSRICVSRPDTDFEEYHGIYTESATRWAAAVGVQVYNNQKRETQRMVQSC